MTKTATVRNARAEDLRAIAELNIEIFSEIGCNYAFFVIANYLMNDTFLVAEGENDEIVGYLLCMIDQHDPTLAWGLGLAVVQDYRGFGVNTLLTFRMLNEILPEMGVKRIRLWTGAHKRVRLMYMRMGFYEVEVLENFYDNDEDRVVMEKMLVSG